MSSDTLRKRLHDRDLRLKKEHDQLIQKVYHETFLLYQEGKIEEINKKIIPKLIEIGDSSIIASIASDFPGCDINALIIAFIGSKPYFKDGSKISDLFRLLRFLTEDDIDKINFNYIVSAILTSSFNNLFYECHLLLEFIGEYNNYFTNAHLDLILTRLIDKIQNSSHPASYLLYKDIYQVPRMNFDLILSGVLLYPNSEAIVYFAENLNSIHLYKLMVEVKRRNQKILMDYFCKYYFESIYFDSSDNYIYLLFLFGNKYVNRYLQKNSNETYESLRSKSLKLEKKFGDLIEKGKNNK